MKRFIVWAAAVAWSGVAHALDANGNQQSDIWEMVHGVSGLSSSGDQDNDRVSNSGESLAGTNPLDPASRPRLGLGFTNGVARIEWPSVAGKRYTIQEQAQPAAGGWAELDALTGSGTTDWVEVSPTSLVRILRLNISDLDTDLDGLSDAEENWIGYNPDSSNTERRATADMAQVQAEMAAASQFTIAVLDGNLREDWPDGAIIAVRRAAGLKPLRVNFALGGSATAGADYTASATGNLLVPAGAREAWLLIQPQTDALAEGTETVTVTLQGGTGYTLGSPTSVSVDLLNADPAHPGAEEAARFLVQAAFGPNRDDPADPDITPENAEEVMNTGFDAWITDQFNRPVGLHQPFVEWADAQPGSPYEPKHTAWWNRAMGTSTLVPGGPAQAPDPLRQRMAFALSQILVISDRTEALGVDYIGMANYYDLMVTHAFGNYRTLLYEVARHPCMGHYLSHAGNRKPDPVLKIHPDENFAREIMQLFTIGLWELNADGTRQLDPQGNFIPTYDNHDIAELARVFTGFQYDEPGEDDTFDNAYYYFRQPMKMYDVQHDCDAKTLVGGHVLSEQTPVPATGAAGLADVNAAVDHLFNHPNVGPFLGRQLIQRFVTSNPSPAYVGRVAAAFNNNGSNVRGDLKAVLRAVLMDPDARSAQKLSDPQWGKLREPFLMAVNLARAFDASAPSGNYLVDNLADLLAQEPLNSPSVFNFYLPGYSPPGPVTAAGLVAPEFQIVNAATAVSGPNYFWHAISEDFNRWGAGSANEAVKINITHELTLHNDADALLRRIDLALTGGMLDPREFQIIRETLARIDSSHWEYDLERVRFAIYMVVNSPNFAVLR